MIDRGSRRRHCELGPTSIGRAIALSWRRDEPTTRDRPRTDRPRPTRPSAVGPAHVAAGLVRRPVDRRAVPLLERAGVDGRDEPWGPATTGPTAPASGRPATVTDPWPTAPRSTGADSAERRPRRSRPDATAGHRGAGGPMVVGHRSRWSSSCCLGRDRLRDQSRSHSNDSARSRHRSPDLPVAGSRRRTPDATPTTPSPRPGRADPDRACSPALVVQQADVGADRTVVLIPQRQPPDPADARPLQRQVPERAAARRAPAGRRRRRRRATCRSAPRRCSTATPAAPAQAFAELRKVRAACPHTPVASPVGEATDGDEFKAAPDGTWPQTPIGRAAGVQLRSTTAAGTTARRSRCTCGAAACCSACTSRSRTARSPRSPGKTIDRGHRRRVRGAHGAAAGEGRERSA